jgi:hypothetical protein
VQLESLSSDLLTVLNPRIISNDRLFSYKARASCPDYWHCMHPHPTDQGFPRHDSPNPVLIMISTSKKSTGNILTPALGSSTVCTSAHHCSSQEGREDPTHGARNLEQAAPFPNDCPVTSKEPIDSTSQLSVSRSLRADHRIPHRSVDRISNLA